MASTATDSHSRVQSNGEREDIDIIQRQAEYELEMKDLNKCHVYAHVTVLVLYWVKTAESYLDVTDEIQRLKEVLGDRYNYTVLLKTLNSQDGGYHDPAFIILKHLVEAIATVQRENSLLIVYYAGHGNPGKDGGLMLNGGNKHGGSDLDGIAWGEAERIIQRHATLADVLLIFDCCYAGALENRNRASFSSRNFEFLGATGTDGVTCIPCPESFTSALIWAFWQLAEEPHGFTTSQLFTKLRQAPDFPPEQTPILHERTTHSTRRLLLAPLPLSSEETLQSLEEQRKFQNDKSGYSLTLQMTFGHLPTTDEVKTMCKGLKHMRRCGELDVEQIIWRGIHRKGRSVFEISTTTRLAADRFLALRSKTRSISGASSIKTVTHDQQRLMDNPSPSDTEQCAEQLVDPPDQDLYQHNSSTTSNNDYSTVPQSAAAPGKRLWYWIMGGGLILSIFCICFLANTAQLGG